MKKLLTIAAIFPGLFLFVGITSASDVETLQPASAITYNEDLTVNGTGRFNSVYIGAEGVGGVTFFNGTIVNIGETVPVTFGDDVRIDGLIWGGPNKGNTTDQALKIADSLLPGLTNVNDLGSGSLKWKDLYLAGALDTTNINYSGNLTGRDAEFSGNINTKSIDIAELLNANEINLQSNLIQERTADGVAKAAVYIEPIVNLDCSSTTQWKKVSRYFNNLDNENPGKDVYCKKVSAGFYQVRFGESTDKENCKINDRYWQLTGANAGYPGISPSASPSGTDANVLRVSLVDNSNTFIDYPVTITIF